MRSASATQKSKQRSSYPCPPSVSKHVEQNRESLRNSKRRPRTSETSLHSSGAYYEEKAVEIDRRLKVERHRQKARKSEDEELTNAKAVQEIFREARTKLKKMKQERNELGQEELSGWAFLRNVSSSCPAVFHDVITVAMRTKTKSRNIGEFIQFSIEDQDLEGVADGLEEIAGAKELAANIEKGHDVTKQCLENAASLFRQLTALREKAASLSEEMKEVTSELAGLSQMKQHLEQSEAAGELKKYKEKQEEEEKIANVKAMQQETRQEESESSSSGEEDEDDIPLEASDCPDWRDDEHWEAFRPRLETWKSEQMNPSHGFSAMLKMFARKARFSQVALQLVSKVGAKLCSPDVLDEALNVLEDVLPDEAKEVQKCNIESEHALEKFDQSSSQSQKTLMTLKLDELVHDEAQIIETKPWPLKSSAEARQELIERYIKLQELVDEVNRNRRESAKNKTELRGTFQELNLETRPRCPQRHFMDEGNGYCPQTECLWEMCCACCSLPAEAPSPLQQERGPSRSTRKIEQEDGPERFLSSKLGSEATCSPQSRQGLRASLADARPKAFFTAEEDFSFSFKEMRANEKSPRSFSRSHTLPDQVASPRRTSNVRLEAQEQKRNRAIPPLKVKSKQDLSFASSGLIVLHSATIQKDIATVDNQATSHWICNECEVSVWLCFSCGLVTQQKELEVSLEGLAEDPAIQTALRLAQVSMAAMSPEIRAEARRIYAKQKEALGIQDDDVSKSGSIVMQSKELTMPGSLRRRESTAGSSIAREPLTPRQFEIEIAPLVSAKHKTPDGNIETIQELPSASGSKGPRKCLVPAAARTDRRPGRVCLEDVLVQRRQAKTFSRPKVTVHSARAAAIERLRQAAYAEADAIAQRLAARLCVLPSPDATMEAQSNRACKVDAQVWNLTAKSLREGVTSISPSPSPCSDGDDFSPTTVSSIRQSPVLMMMQGRISACSSWTESPTRLGRSRIPSQCCDIDQLHTSNYCWVEPDDTSSSKQYCKMIWSEDGLCLGEECPPTYYRVVQKVAKISKGDRLPPLKDCVQPGGQ